MLLQGNVYPNTNFSFINSLRIDGLSLLINSSIACIEIGLFKKVKKPNIIQKTSLLKENTKCKSCTITNDIKYLLLKYFQLELKTIINISTFQNVMCFGKFNIY